VHDSFPRQERGANYTGIILQLGSYDL